MLELDHLLATWAKTKPYDLAFANENHELTFAELNSYTRKIATLLAQSGISRGDLVCTILPSYPGWVFTLALHLLGVTTTSKSNPLPFGPEAIPDWCIGLTSHPQIAANRTIIFDQRYLEKINAAPEMAKVPVFAGPADLAGIFGTSGTSGDEKYISLTVAEFESMVELPWSPEFPEVENILSFFSFGMLWPLVDSYKCLTAGRAFYSFHNYPINPVAQKYPINTLLGAPMQFAGFLDVFEKQGIKLPQLKRVILAGSVPSQKLLNRITDNLECEIFNMYGSTEAGNITMTRIGNEFAKGAAINPLVDLQIVDDQDRQVARGEIGNIRYKKLHMANSYYKNAAATAEFFKEGYFYPGDLGFIDNDGYLNLSGRISEVINLGGIKINPESIDAVALTQSGVIDCAAFAYVTKGGVENLALALVTGQEFDLELLKSQFSVTHVPKPAHFVSVGAIPRNANGKILRNQLTNEFSAEIGSRQGDLSG